MRYILKGGVWKNAEDEVLKAAVMKYGLNQWSSIASLLQRKTAKQCKARWYEWLDPSIKKTEWTREEEEKLLHLAKIFPCQWRTIAPIVGRTPTQCVEHYEKLLDQAQGKEDDDNDPRKLKPGEINPTPETEPAKPDPIDMDEDMKEMLAEARVRLANTRGKKAKRLARERMIEEARRLASLQKKRELKAAGIEWVIKKKIRNIDYNQEVPFERNVPQFAYNVGKDETPVPKVQLGNISLQELEGTKKFEEFEKLRKFDTKKIKKMKEKSLPEVVEKINKLNNQIIETKTKLVIPQPQLQDKDLEQLGKMNTNIYASQDQSQNNQITKALIGNYTQQRDLMTPTPMRTPRYHDNLMKEALLAAQHLSMQTPLIGGENISTNDSNLVGENPKQFAHQTPNIISQMLKSTPLTTNTRDQQSIYRETGMKTPFHDQLKLNEDFDDKNWESQSASQMSGANINSMQSAKIEKLKQIQMRQTLQSSLSSLPKPKNEYQFEIPEMQGEGGEENAQNLMVMDAEDRDRLIQERKKKEYQQKLKLRTLVVQKNLPRPFTVPETLYENLIEDESIPEERKMAEKMLNDEIFKLILNDQKSFPFPGCKLSKQSMTMEIELTLFKENELNYADKLIADEIQSIKSELKHGKLSKKAQIKKWEEITRQSMYNQHKNIYQNINKLPRDEKLQLLGSNYEQKKTQFQREVAQIEKIEQHINRLLKGYENRAGQLQATLDDKYSHIDQLDIQYHVFNLLKTQEQFNVSERMNELQDFYKKLVSKEILLQKKYEELKNEKEDLINDQDHILR